MKTETSSRAAVWRRLLLDHALALREAILSGHSDPTGTIVGDNAEYQMLAQELGPLASEAIYIVNAYTSGAVATESRLVAASGSKGNLAGRAASPEFGSRLNIILNGLEPHVEEGAEGAGRPPLVIQKDLWQLLYKVRESAEMAYARELDLIELDRRILFLLHNIGPLVPADISSAVGMDKAQVSRAVKRLLEIKMVERGQLRAPLRLTRKGEVHTYRLLRLAELRNRELTFDIGDAELEAFFAVIEKLLDQSVLLYEQERKLSQVVEMAQYPRPGAPVESESESKNESNARIVLDRSRIISPLMTLSSYFGRSGSLAFKRLTGLSNFEAWVLNEIGMASPIEWNVLVERLDRDHSQAGRTINALIERGLVLREGKPGRRNGCFAPTAEGERLYEVIQETGRQRSTFLLSPLSQAERDSFLGTFDKIRRNAVVQLERERAFEELGQG